MDETEEHEADGSEEGPATGPQESQRLRLGIQLEHDPSALSGTCDACDQDGQHKNGGNDDLVGRYGNDVGHQNHTV